MTVVRCVDNSSLLVESKYYIRAMSRTAAFMNPGDRKGVNVFVAEKGVPLCGHKLPVKVKIISKKIPKEKELKVLNALKVNGHTSVTVTTDCKGEASLTLEAGDPGNPRGFVDGCPYNVIFVPEQDDLFNDVKFCVRVFDEFVSNDKPTWYGEKGVYHIFRQYYHLFPVMRHVLLLGDYESVTNPRNIQYIKMAMTRPIDDPSFMPVTRDLSRNKTNMVLKWLGQEHRRLSILPAKGRRGKMSLEELREQLQLATQIEHYTIPVYLYAFYSIKDGYNNDVREIIRSIYIDEMIHMSLAANILNAIGGSPDFVSPHVIPVYPSRLPGDLHPELTLHLSPLSKHLIKDIFMHIEMPRYLPEDDEDVYAHTVGGFYKRIKRYLKRLEREQNDQGSTIFTGDPARQVDYDLPGHLKIFKVTNLDEALQALELIVDQGEGSSQVMPRDDHGQLSHYYKFQEIVEGRKLVKSERGQMEFIGDRVDFDPAAVHPFPDNPHVKDYPDGSLARKYAEAFSQRYLDLLSQLHRVFNGSPERVTKTFATMFHLNMKAKEMVGMQVRVGDSSMHAGPTFENPLNL